MSEKAIEMKEGMSRETMGMKSAGNINVAEEKTPDRGRQGETEKAKVTRMELEYSLARPS